MKTQGGEVKTPKATWFLMFAAFIWFEILLIGFGSFLALNYAHSGHPAPGVDALKSIAYMVIPLAVVACIYWVRAKLSGPRQETPQEFTRNSVVGLALAELGLVFAVVAFMRTDWLQLVLFGVVTLVIDFTIILPTGLRYWASQASA